MKLIDFGQAFGLAILILALDLAAAFGTVSAWAAFIEPGHPRAFYIQAAPRLSIISTRIAGPLLFALIVWLFSRRNGERNPFAFALMVFMFYVLADGGMVTFHGFFSPVIGISLGLKLMGALAGAILATSASRKHDRNEEP